RAAGRAVELGITLNMAPSEPASDVAADREATRRADGLGIRLYVDPLVRGRYPEDVVADLAEQGVWLPVQDGDLPIIATPIDVLGVNYYSAHRIAGTDAAGRSVDETGRPVSRTVPHGEPVTAMGWEIVPHGITDLLLRLARDYPGLPLMITENGAAFDDVPDEHGFVADDDRVDYLAGHVRAVADAVARGADVRGYFAWSLLDNFEWSFGYDKRFGLVRVDYATQERAPKRSALWYRDTIRRVRGG
ncbi:MAG TPA: family 1 glycosylhydrolase, partial [Pseudonocardiaceae bacterium]|nr:family 1 glycosylhydrolase [Pseudonocardiaceae bacterium]